MKHVWKVTLILLSFYIVAQVFGLVLINQDLNVEVIDGVNIVQHPDTIIGERPETTGQGAFLYILIGVALGTILFLLIIKFKKLNIWKIWFFLAAFIAMSLSLGVILNASIALVLALILTYMKIFRRNLIIHNLTEVLMYSGIAIFLVPMLDLFWVSILLIAFSLYDVYAVWKSKHMVKMAEFQADSKLFAGLTIPYKGKKIYMKTKTSVLPLAEKRDRTKRELVVLDSTNIQTAVLGGGDIAFPLIFSGVAMEYLIINGVSKITALYQSLIITICSALALLMLFILAEKEKFYPAMPFVTSGCFFGLLILFLI